MTNSPSTKQECTACGGKHLTRFFENRDVPAYVNFLWKSGDAARACPRGDIILALCRDCGLIFNVAFDPWKLVYREGYENSLHFSSVFQTYAETLADSLVDRFDLHAKTIVEIGCGDGVFLDLLCERGGNRGIGFDPSPRERGNATSSGRIEIIPDYYSERYADRPADFVCCRHTLEHVAHPGEMLGPVRRSIGDRDDLPVFFEVPNAMYILENHFVWDIIYEHTSYFTRTSLTNAFVHSGFRVTDIYDSFSGQYLCIEAVGTSEDIARVPMDNRLIDVVEKFETAHVGYYEIWRTKLAALQEADKRVVLWGAGSKGVMFMNSLDAGGVIEHVVDINPKKQGKFIAGCGQKIVPPSFLAARPPDVVIVANPVYMDEIAVTLRDIGVEPEMIPL